MPSGRRIPANRTDTSSSSSEARTAASAPELVASEKIYRAGSGKLVTSRSDT
jgi:hypothetical protein